MSDLSWLNPTPHAIAVYASQPLSPVATQHSLPSGRYSLLGPDLHRQDRTSFAWRTHSITSSARASSEGGTVMPRALADLRLITNSNLVGCCTGRSPGLAPLRMRSTYVGLSIDPLQLGKNARSVVQPTSLTRLYASHRDAALHGMHIGCAEGLRFLLSLRRERRRHPSNQDTAGRKI